MAEAGDCPTGAGTRCIVVVPTLNEAPNVPELVRRVGAAAPEAHLMLVDDQSTDGTREVALEAFAGRAGYTVLTRTGRRGLGRAYSEGFRVALDAGYERLVQMDADLSHDPASIPALLTALDEADLVIGSRYCKGGGVRDWSYRRVLLSRWANTYVRAITGLPVGDVTAGFRAWRAEALRAIRVHDAESLGYSFQVETTVRAFCAGLRIREVPITFTDRKRGTSKVTPGVMLESMKMPWRLRRTIATMKRKT